MGCSAHSVWCPMQSNGWLFMVADKDQPHTYWIYFALKHKYVELFFLKLRTNFPAATAEIGCSGIGALNHQRCIIPLLKIVPNKYTIYSCRITFAKNYSAQLFQDILEPFSRIKVYICDSFLEISVLCEQWEQVNCGLSASEDGDP